MMSTPKISFIVPIYNTAKYLAQCLDSILAQPIDKEIILINDGSTDNSKEIATAYAEKYPIITLIHQANAGLSATRNVGLRLARGEYVYFCDSDDYINDTQWSDIYTLAKMHKVDVLKLQIMMFLDDDPSQEYHWQTATNQLERNTGQLYTGYQFFVQLTHSRWIPAVCWSLYRREFLLENQLFFVEKLKAEDQIFYTQVLTCRPDVQVLELPLTAYHYRYRQNSLSRSPNDVGYLLDLHRVIAWLNAWEQSHEFSSAICQGIKIIISHLEFAIEQQLQQMHPDNVARYHELRNAQS